MENLQNKDFLEKIQFYYNQGLNDRQISKILNVSSSYVGRHRELLGLTSIITLRKERDFENIKPLVGKGYTDREIAEMLNLKPKNVRHYRLKLRVPPAQPEINYSSQRDRIKGYMIRNSKFMSKRRNIEFDLKYTDFDLPEYCPILGAKLTFGSESSGQHPFHASLDRIDNTKGYIKGNVIVISRLANCMKNSANFEQLKLFSTNITKLINYFETQGTLGNITDVFPDIKLYPET